MHRVTSGTREGLGEASSQVSRRLSAGVLRQGGCGADMHDELPGTRQVLGEATPCNSFHLNPSQPHQFLLPNDRQELVKRQRNCPVASLSVR